MGSFKQLSVKQVQFCWLGKQLKYRLVYVSSWDNKLWVKLSNLMLTGQSANYITLPLLQANTKKQNLTNQ